MVIFGTPEELTGTLLFLLSDLASFITWVVMMVEKGF